MSDVLSIAMKRREKLKVEIAKLDQFLKFAVQLADLESARVAESGIAIATPEPRAHAPEPRVEVSRARDDAPEAEDEPETEEVMALPETPRKDVMARASLFRRLNGEDELRRAVG